MNELFYSNVNPNDIDITKLNGKAPCSVCMIQNTCEDICKAYYQWRKNERKNKISKK